MGRKLKFLLIYENMFKSIATSHSEYTGNYEDKASQTQTALLLILLTPLAMIELTNVILVAYTRSLKKSNVRCNTTNMYSLT